jgi:glutaredoxin
MASKVTVFSTPTCPYCKRVKQIMGKRGIEFEDFDVSSDKAAYERMREITEGARRVPVVQIDDQVLVGPDDNELEKALERYGN